MRLGARCRRTSRFGSREASRRAVGLACLAAVGAALAIRRVGRRSGATHAEVSGSLPGDDLVPEPMWTSTRAITIAAPPHLVWPWIVQMGFPDFRAGWYTPYWLDRLQWGIKQRSADTLRPDLQRVDVGDKIPDSADWSVFFTVETIEHERALVLVSTRHLIKPLRAIRFSWAFVLQPIAANRTRLSIRARARYDPRWAGRILTPMIDVGDFLNTSAMLRAIRRRAERQPDTVVARSAPRRVGEAPPA
jgi:hypothetical protein